MSWKTVKLGEVADILSGSTPKSTVVEYWDGNIAWATPKDLSNLTQKEIDSTERKITEAGFQSCSTRMLPPRSVLFSSRAPIGLVAINTIPMCTNQGFKSFIPDTDKLFSDFLYWWLKANRAKLEYSGRGATFKEVSKSIVAEIEIPLPPLEQQKRIADILDAADALRVKRRQVLEQLDELVQSVFLEMFGDPVTNPKGWDIKSLDDVGSIGTGSTPSRRKVENYQGAIPWVKSTEVDGSTILTTSEFVSEIGKKAARLKIYPKESIIIALYGQGKTRGQSALLGINATTNQACCAITPSSEWDALYVLQYLKFSYERLRAASRGGNQQNLNVSIIKSFPILAPPLELQNRFAEIVSAIEAQKVRVRGHLGELDALFASLQQQAFSGEL